MNKRRVFSGFALVLLAAVLGVGFFQVLEKRFAKGDIYPHYASFRSDPLGTSALYEALSSIPGLEVRRSMVSLSAMSDLDPDTTLFLIGISRNSFRSMRTKEEEDPIMKAVRDGARLVMTVNPGNVDEQFQASSFAEERDWLERREALREERRKLREKELSEEEEKRKEEQIEEMEEELEQEREKVLGKTLEKYLGFELESMSDFERSEEGWEVTSGESSSIKAWPFWFSQYFFKLEHDDWKVEGKTEGGPVVIERNYGNGSIVLASDSYFASNEALHLGADSQFLAWLAGDKKKLVFDETIHGSQESGGAMKLMRRYRVHGVFFGIILVVLLWAWRNSFPLAPGDDGEDRGVVGMTGAVAGEGDVTGMTRMLQKSVAKSDLLRQCVASWRESQHREVPKQIDHSIDQLLHEYENGGKRRDIVATFSRITECVRRR